MSEEEELLENEYNISRGDDENDVGADGTLKDSDDDDELNQNYDKWKQNEMSEYNNMKTLKEAIQKQMSDIGGGLYDLVAWKDIIFELYCTSLDKKIMTLPMLSDLLMLCSKMYRRHMTLYNLISSFFDLIFSNYKPISDEKKGKELKMFKNLIQLPSNDIGIRSSSNNYGNADSTPSQRFDFIAYRLLIKSHKKTSKQNKMLLEENENLGKQLNQLKSECEEWERKYKIEFEEKTHLKERVNNLETQQSKMFERLASSLSMNEQNQNKMMKIEKETNKIMKSEVASRFNEYVEAAVRKLNSFVDLFAQITTQHANQIGSEPMTKINLLQIHVGKLLEKFGLIKVGLMDIMGELNYYIEDRIQRAKKDSERWKLWKNDQKQIQLVRHAMMQLRDIINKIRERLGDPEEQVNPLPPLLVEETRLNTKEMLQMVNQIQTLLTKKMETSRKLLTETMNPSKNKKTVKIDENKNGKLSTVTETPSNHSPTNQSYVLINILDEAKEEKKKEVVTEEADDKLKYPIPDMELVYESSSDEELSLHELNENPLDILADIPTSTSKNEKRKDSPKENEPVSKGNSVNRDEKDGDESKKKENTSNLEKTEVPQKPQNEEVSSQKLQLIQPSQPPQPPQRNDGKIQSEKANKKENKTKVNAKSKKNRSPSPLRGWNDAQNEQEEKPEIAIITGTSVTEPQVTITLAQPNQTDETEMKKQMHQKLMFMKEVYEQRIRELETKLNELRKKYSEVVRRKNLHLHEKSSNNEDATPSSKNSIVPSVRNSLRSSHHSEASTPNENSSRHSARSKQTLKKCQQSKNRNTSNTISITDENQNEGTDDIILVSENQISNWEKRKDRILHEQRSKLEATLAQLKLLDLDYIQQMEREKELQQQQQRAYEEQMKKKKILMAQEAESQEPASKIAERMIRGVFDGERPESANSVQTEEQEEFDKKVHTTSSSFLDEINNLVPISEKQSTGTLSVKTLSLPISEEPVRLPTILTPYQMVKRFGNVTPELLTAARRLVFNNNNNNAPKTKRQYVTTVNLYEQIEKQLQDEEYRLL